VSEDNGASNDFTTLGGLLAGHARRLGSFTPSPRWTEAGPMTAARYGAMRPRLALWAGGEGTGGERPAAARTAGPSGTARAGELSLAPEEEPVTEADRPAETPPPEPLRAAQEAPSTGLDGNLVAEIERLLDRKLPPVRVATGTKADAAARAGLADALTIDETIHFRSGTFQPDRPEGLALIAHEMVHADAIRTLPEPLPRSAAAEREERGALAAEARVRAVLADRPPLQLGPLARPAQSRMDPHPGAPPDLSARPGTRRPRAAESDRALPTADAMPKPPAPGLSEDDMREIKESVYRDLMERIRTDFERGG